MRKCDAPLPRLTYDERMMLRAQKMSGLQLYDRECAKSGRTLKTAFAPESPWIVWHREEYDREFSS